jgi:hypothetical protein
VSISATHRAIASVPNRATVDQRHRQKYETVPPAAEAIVCFSKLTYVTFRRIGSSYGRDVGRYRLKRSRVSWLGRPRVRRARSCASRRISCRHACYRSLRLSDANRQQAPSRRPSRSCQPFERGAARGPRLFREASSLYAMTTIPASAQRCRYQS